MKFIKIINIAMMITERWFGKILSAVFLIFSCLLLSGAIFELAWLDILKFSIISFAFFRNTFKPIFATVLIEYTTVLYYSCKNITYFWFFYPIYVDNYDSIIDSRGDIDPKGYLKFILEKMLPYVKKSFSEKLDIFLDALLTHFILIILFFIMISVFYYIRILYIKKKQDEQRVAF